MKKNIYWSFLFCFVFLYSCKDGEMQQTAQMGPLSLPVVEIPSRTVTGYTEYPVSIEGTVNAAVRAKIPGYITEVLVDAGQEVREGQTLFRLETSSLSQEASAAQANVNAAQVEVDKLKPLVEKGIISPVQLETAKARLEQAKAGYSSIAANIGYANIKSPVNGYVGAIRFREGTLVGPGDPQPLTTVSKIEDVYAFFAMNETDYLDFLQATEGATLSEKIANLPPVELVLANGESFPEKGKIETISRQVDPTTGTVSFRAVFPNDRGILTNGNSGIIRIPKVYENVPVVPEVSTYERQGLVYVYKILSDTLATPTVIDVEDRVDNVIVVKNGVQPGDRIVAQGVGKLQGPTPVVPQLVPFDSIASSLSPVFK